MQLGGLLGAAGRTFSDLFGGSGGGKVAFMDRGWTFSDFRRTFSDFFARKSLILKRFFRNTLIL